MDRRRRKTREAIFSALTGLLRQKGYARISVREIIEAADVGRTTFYAHFDTKDDLLRALCATLFEHVFTAVGQMPHAHGSGRSVGGDPFEHLLHHIDQDDREIRTMLLGDTSGTAQSFFRDGVRRLVRAELAAERPSANLPADFLIDHLSSCFINTVMWWLHCDREQAPEQIARLHRAVTDPVIRSLHSRDKKKDPSI